ncbi:MAG: twin-arginine translocase subunit TatC [Dethiobacteria bacterium]|jgi:sec-independent protein translocase protein TatC
MVSPKSEKSDLEMMSIFEHLEELRKRLIVVAVVILIMTFVCFGYVDNILFILTRQAEGLELIYTTPAEAFTSQIRLALIAAVLVTLPFTIYQALAFVLPALRTTEKRALIPLLVSMIILFFTGMAFGYFAVFPFALHFFLGFSGEGLLPLFTISRYISFVVSFLVAFGLVFQVPLVFWFLGRMSIISSQFLSANRKYALLVNAILSAIITPPDVFSQVLMIIPLAILYEVGFVLVRLSERKRAKLEKVQTELN